MLVRINGESNFFLFQDIPYFFLLFLKHEHSFPIDCSGKYGTTTYHLFHAWSMEFHIKLFACDSTDKKSALTKLLKKWMITTNVAILSAQKERRGIEYLDRYNEEYLTKNKPEFEISFDKDSDTYIVHLDDETTELLLCSIDFYNSFKTLNPNLIINELVKYFSFKETESIKECLTNICDLGCFHEKYTSTFEIINE